MRRLAVLGTAFGALATPCLAEAQPESRTYRVGTLVTVSQKEAAPYITALEDGLHKLGWVKHRTLAFEHRYADLRPERFPDLAAELIRLKVDVIVAPSTAAIAAAHRATTRLPIVMVQAVRPVESRFAASLARPGGNVTGLTLDVTAETMGKCLQLLKEMAPGLSRVAVLRSGGRSSAAGDPYGKATEDAARALRLTLQSVHVQGPEDLDGAFAAIARQRPDGLYVWQYATTLTHRGRIVDFAARNRLPAVYDSREFADAGGLMTYGVDNQDLYRRAAIYVDRILRGAKPADLPIERPTKFELVVNRRAVTALGLTIPRSVALQADHIIE